MESLLELEQDVKLDISCILYERFVTSLLLLSTSQSRTAERSESLLCPNSLRSVPVFHLIGPSYSTSNIFVWHTFLLYTTLFIDW